MTQAQQPEALRISTHLRSRAKIASKPGNIDTLSAAAANELERLHARVQELEAKEVNIEEFRVSVTEAARTPLLNRIAELQQGWNGHQIAEPTAAHPDDVAVDALAALMKAKLAKQRGKGYSGWDTDCTQQHLSNLLRGHVDKGDPVDVANFCAFLLARGEGIAAAPQAVQPAVPVGGQSRFKGEQDWGWCSIAHVAMVLATPLEWQNYEVRYVYAHPAEGVPAQAVASIYITENGERELDDWKVPLSVGRNLLYTQPAAHGLDAKDCDMFWVADEPDQNHDTLHDAVVRAYEDGGLQTDSTVEIQCAKCIGNVVARITSTDPLAFELLIDAELTAQADQGTEMKVSVE